MTDLERALLIAILAEGDRLGRLIIDWQRRGWPDGRDPVMLKEIVAAEAHRDVGAVRVDLISWAGRGASPAVVKANQRALGRLAAAGLLERLKPPGGERLIYVRLTPLGALMARDLAAGQPVKAGGRS